MLSIDRVRLLKKVFLWIGPVFGISIIFYHYHQLQQNIFISGNSKISSDLSQSYHSDPLPKEPWIFSLRRLVTEEKLWKLENHRLWGWGITKIALLGFACAPSIFNPYCNGTSEPIAIIYTQHTSIILMMIYSENTIKLYSMTWNKIQINIFCYFYNRYKHIKFLFLKPIWVVFIKANIGGKKFIIFTLEELFQLYRRDIHNQITLKQYIICIHTVYILKMMIPITKTTNKF